MTKASIISCIIHLIILVFITNVSSTNIPPLTNIGDNIEVRMISKDRGTLTTTQKGSGSEDTKDIKEEENIEKVEKIEEVSKEEPDSKVEKVKTIEAAVVEKESLKKENVKIEKSVKKKIEVVQEEKKHEKIEIVEIEIDKDDLKSGEEIVKREKKETVAATKDITNQSKGSQKDNFGEDLIELSDGTFMAKHQGIKGLSYGFISSPEPSYPSRARRLGFQGDIIVKVIMEFNSNGRLEDIKIIGDRDKFGFANEVEKTVKNWRLTTIIYENNEVKMRFYKSFKFQEQS